MLLHDLVRRAGAKGVALAGQIGAGDRLGDRRQRITAHRHRQNHPLQTRGDLYRKVGCQLHIIAGIHACHPVYRQHVADPIDHRDGGGGPEGLRLVYTLGQYPAHVILGKKAAGAGALAFAGRVVGGAIR